MNHLLDTGMRVIALSVGAVCFLIAGLVCYEVINRTVFGYSLVWVEEVTGYLIGYVAFVGAAATLHQDGHVSVDLLVSHLKGRPLLVLRAAGELVIAAALALLAYLAVLFWLDAFETGERSGTLLGIELWIPYLSFALGAGLLLLVQIVRCVALFTGSAARPQADAALGADAAKEVAR
ncbi:TRAP transporter small permease [Roseixanthobacter glucoisosaccharinicivorans]|uniref:TRAP transporter small permease n=1 Tax=Roseixanthobacter glucoisosaccharinicivorans TaxID=3119923 RepID=UPI00372A0726